MSYYMIFTYLNGRIKNTVNDRLSAATQLSTALKYSGAYLVIYKLTPHLC